MRRGIGRMSNLIADILDLAKLETGRALDIAGASFAPLLRAVVQDHQLAAEQKHLALELRMDLDDALVECDAAQIRRALDNLIGNAIKYTPAGGRVDIDAERLGAEIVIKVADTGVSISAQDAPRVFERFYRAQDASGLAIEGTGLGLAIVRAIAEQHGGSVSIESELGRGSVFSLRLPLSQRAGAS
jgi:signal transduction histidine kinase